jgi:hypothetical protein
VSSTRSGDELALAPRQRRGVDLEHHRQRGLVHRDRRQALRGFRIADGDADVHILEPGDGDDVAGAGAVHRAAREPRERQHLPDPAGAAILVAVAQDHVLSRLHRAAPDAADADASHVGVVVERGHLQLQRPFGIRRGLGHVLEDGLEQGGHVGLLLRGIQARPTLQGRRVHDGEIQLRVGGAELVEQVEGLIDHPAGTRARAVDLVDHDDRLQAERQRLARDEARLRHRSFHRIDQQQHAIHHRQHPLDLAAEIRVARRVDHVDAHAAIIDGAVLGQDGDAALLLDGVGIHDPLADLLVRGEGAGLLEQAVDQRGLAVVDVGDDGDVADRALHGGEGPKARGKRPARLPVWRPVSQARLRPTMTWTMR